MSHDIPHPIIGITMGDPVGVGPEILIKAFEIGNLHEICRPLVLGDTDWLATVGRGMGSALRFRTVSSPDSARFRIGELDVLSVSNLGSRSIPWGQPTSETGKAMIAYITTAVDLCLSEEIAALVTCPINKAAMAKAGYPFPGHTELIAERTGGHKVVMMLAGDRLRVVLVTVHTALSRVSAMITPDNIWETIAITAKALKQRFGIDTPRLAVAALNPHAGEEGLFGDEEFRLILPAIERARSAGIDVSGPFPPDTVFYYAAQGRWDVVVCMYHDQGLIPFKLLHFKDGVNTTLGLPIIRTSVDHGTAYDIAGSGKAEPDSLLAAIRMAAFQVSAREMDRRRGDFTVDDHQ